MANSTKKSIDNIWVFFGLVISLWIFSFRVFLWREAPLSADAISFYDHLKFYLDNILKGHYPLWDPLWSLGSPNELFLRRIGAFNPFLLLIAIPYKLGLSYWCAFAGFIVFYFFLGMFGFYKLTRNIVNDRHLAFMAFVLLSFSSLGTRLFDSYLMMFMTPMIWFFYFLLDFGRRQRRSALAGMSFCLMLLLTTYIPFYFITLVLSFFLFYVLLYPKEAGHFVSRFSHFVMKNPIFSAFCLLAVCAALVPGYLFFKEAGRGLFSMPLRNFNAGGDNVLQVKSDVTSYWAIPEDLLYSWFYLKDLQLFNLAVFYVPFFAFILVLAGWVTKIDRKVVLLFLWIIFLFLLGSPHLSPLYQFLNQHVFFFHYFRNLHFFLWLGILPLFILLLTLQLKQFLAMLASEGRTKTMALWAIFVVHMIAAGLLVWQKMFDLSTWLSLALSLLFFVQYSRQGMGPSVRGILLAAIIVQPLAVYQYLSGNVYKYYFRSVYEQYEPEATYTLPKNIFIMISGLGDPGSLKSGNRPFYFGTRWFNQLWENVNEGILKEYTFHRFILYDRVATFDDEKEKDWQVITQSLKNKLNLAFISDENQVQPQDNRSDSGPPIFVEKASDQLRILVSNVNMVKVETDLADQKFLVYNDNYYPGWRVFLNGRETRLYRANIAFKGVWVPAGRQIVEFRYGEAWRYKLEVGMLIFYMLFFIFLVRCRIRDTREKTQWLENVRDL